MDIIENDRTLIINPLTGRNLELDIFIPELNKAIEFNGIYWNSSRYSKQKDKIKEQQCKKNGIDLLIIKELNWIKNKDLCLRKIRNFLL